MASEHFGSGKFKAELWIAQKKIFSEPKGVDVEIVPICTFEWLFADKDGKLVRTLAANGGGGWTGVDLPSLGLFGDYSIGFRNTGAGEITIKQGDVRL